MSKIYIEEKAFEKINFSESGITKGVYENCRFLNCIFSNSDLSSVNFAECEFQGCDLSIAKINGMSLRNVKFKDCKLIGLHFENCNEFAFNVGFENCILNLSSFYKLNLKKTQFKNCSLREVDFTESNLGESIFDNCNLAEAIFQSTLMEKADFRTSYNYSINPETNRIKKAKFSKEGVIGLLYQYDIEIE